MILKNNTGIGMTPRCGSRYVWTMLRQAGLTTSLDPPLGRDPKSQFAPWPQFSHVFQPEKREELGLDKVYRLARNPYLHFRSLYRLNLIHKQNAIKENQLEKLPRLQFESFEEWANHPGNVRKYNGPMVTKEHIKYIDDFCILEDAQSFFDRNFPEYNIKFEWGAWYEREKSNRYDDKEDLKYYQENPWAVDMVKSSYRLEFETIDFGDALGEFAKL